jgi:transcriptional regulatory protein LevR
MTEAVATMTRRVREGHSERLDLLETHGQIDGPARRSAERFVATLAAQFDLAPDSDGAAMFLTHVAIAFTRVRRGEPAPAVPDILEEELSGRVEEREAVAAAAKAVEEELDGPVPASELVFMTAHVCALRGDDVS